MRERFRAKNPKSWMLRFHTQTAGSTLTAQQPEVNIVRTAIQAMAAVVGGTQSLHTNGYDEALAIPTEEAARIALRTQQIIAHESGVAQTVDPFAGSYAIEALTQEIENKASHYIEKIDSLGGMIRAVEQGFAQQQIQNAAYDAQQKIDREDAIVVGVNRFSIEEEKALNIQRIDEALERKQIERVRALRVGRNTEAWRGAMRHVKESAANGDNLVPAVIDAVEKNCTVGEISNQLREVFGEHRETVVL
jgi:methylmalonyl-CoA mutase, N-terminal domain